MNKYVLKNERLSIGMFLGGNYYKKSRFDWMGMITEVTLDGKDRFCTKESLIEGKGTEGRGLYNEFGIEEPVGYEEAVVGEYFPKIGIGLLKKEDNNPYDFFRDYLIDKFESEVDVKKDCITFTCNPKEVNGYSIKYVKKISIKNDELIIEYSLKNLGTKVIETTEYCHNFISINDNPIGSDYTIKFSYPVKIDNKPKVFNINKNEITINQDVKDVFYCRLKEFSTDKEQYFELIHKPSGVGFRESSYFNIERVAIWGMPHVISPEIFNKIKINPGEIQEWKRVYRFFN